MADRPSVKLIRVEDTPCVVANVREPGDSMGDP